MRDQFFRDLCASSTEYDKVVNWIRDNNKEGPACQGVEPEEFAVRVVHDCINAVLFDDAGNYSTTGMCIAVRASSDPKSESYKKVVLAIKL